jgi:hypothetical protein
MKLIIFYLCLFVSVAASSQRVVDVSSGNVSVPNILYAISGQAYVNTKFVSLVEGSPFFNEEWMTATLISNDGKEYKNVSAKLDLIDGDVHYMKDGSEFLATTPLKEVILTDTNGENYRFIHSSAMPKTTNPLATGWYLWLHTGSVSLYKAFAKTLSEIKPYNSATTEQRISTTEKYLILYNNVFLEVKKLKDAPVVLANKKTELEEFLKNKDDKKATIDDRFTAFIEYYNSLFKEEK